MLRIRKKGIVNMSGVNLAEVARFSEMISKGQVDPDKDLTQLPKDQTFVKELCITKLDSSPSTWYPVVHEGKVLRSLLVAMRTKAALARDEGSFTVAGQLIDEIDKTKNYSGENSLSLFQEAWSTFEIKEVKEDQRLIQGIATTPTPDRMEDIVEPMGAEFELPLPFLWQHDSMLPVGNVIQAKMTKNGIPVTIQMASIPEAGTLKDRLDEAWQSIKYKLVRGLSIGFSPIEYSYMEETGGYRFIKWAWLELSGVTIPANSEATITAIKSFDNVRVIEGVKRFKSGIYAGAGIDFDENAHAATGNDTRKSIKLHPGASGRS